MQQNLYKIKDLKKILKIKLKTNVIFFETSLVDCLAKGEGGGGWGGIGFL